ncbi:hypothetical protein GpartN1_g5329.t1 [Galdieria partita]|uniref:Zinc finger PHD-type domain-containing protein n=1 Tax=Galdieria partita TaxID=83374 RepID=A0A9C7US89_9RHOD|nr:hypothetical protein GpartN1_g5329.t1 [Galdieria partita]
MSVCSTSLESSQIPKWLLDEWIPSCPHDGNEVDSHPVSHLIPCAICLSLVPWNFSSIHPFIASHCIRLCRNCLESIEKRRMELADKGLLFSNEQSCACCSSESKNSQTLFTCAGCTRSYCKVCVTRILGEYAVATGLVQLQGWYCPLCVRFNVQAKETLKSSRKDQFVLLSLVSFAQARNWETPEALPQLIFRSLERKVVEFAFNNIAGPDDRVLERYENNFQQYCSWLNEREQSRWEQRKREREGKLLIPKKESIESNGVHKKTDESFIHHMLCFWCKEPEATITCSFPRCSKTYHRGCIMSEIVEGSDWICPWHACLSCGAVESNENILKKCRTCPISFCASHVPADKGLQGEEVYYYGDQYILCQRCTPFVERPSRRLKSCENSHSAVDMDNNVRTDNHKHASNHEMAKDWKRSRIEKTGEESSQYLGIARREPRNRTSKAVSHSSVTIHSVDDQEAVASHRRAGRKPDDVNSRIIRLVAERAHQDVDMNTDKMMEYIQEDIESLGVSGPCRLAALYVLKKAGRPLTTAEIAERMVLEGLWYPTGATPVNTIAGLLSSDSKKVKERNGSYIYFDRLGPSLFVYNRRGRG